MDNIKISVIIPFHKDVSLLIEAVDSVLNQTYQDIEIIIVNDGSNENVAVFLNLYGDKIKYIKQKNKGAATARNVGIDIATGQYIAFLDSDDLWEQQKLELQLKEMIENNAVWSHTNYVRFEDNEILKEVDLVGFEGEVFPKCLSTNPIATPCVMIKSEVFQNKQYKFQEGMKSGEDLYLWMLLAKSYPLLLVRDSLTKVRMRGTNSALLAYSQLRSRAQTWLIIKQTNFLVSSGSEDKIKVFLPIAYNLCVANYKFLRNLKNDNIKEWLAKFLYIIPWGIFKLLK